MCQREVVKNISGEGASELRCKGEGWAESVPSTGNNRYKLPRGRRKQEGQWLRLVNLRGESFLLLIADASLASKEKSQYLQQSADVVFIGVPIYSSYPVFQPLLNDCFFFCSAPKQILFVGLLDKMSCYSSQSRQTWTIVCLKNWNLKKKKKVFLINLKNKYQHDLKFQGITKSLTVFSNTLGFYSKILNYIQMKTRKIVKMLFTI